MNITNLIPAITVSLLVTNESIRWPVTMETAPCPEGMIGCLVMHYREVPVPNPTNRWRVTKIRRVERVEMPSIGVTNTIRDELLSETETDEFAETTWRTGATRTNEVWRGSIIPFGSGTNWISSNAIGFSDLTTTNVLTFGTNVSYIYGQEWIVTNPRDTRLEDLAEALDRYVNMLELVSNTVQRVIKSLEER